MNRTFIILGLVCNVTLLLAQPSKPESTLLWRISGNGLQKSSYLYGTMHVRDKRVFNFADSVLLKLDECEAFSTEIDPDSAVYQLLSDKFSSNDFKLKNYLGDEEYRELQRELMEESGFDPAMFKNQNPFLLKHFINQQNHLRNDMPTFLDAHLYNLARENGKKLVAVENVKFQSDLLQNLSKMVVSEVVKEELGLNKRTEAKDLLSVYLAADLVEIDKISHYMSDSAYSLMFTKRNHNMCKRISEYAPLHSTFFAIGAGHLPGKDGLIELLRDKGYTVTPVIPTYKGVASKFKSKKLPKPWYTTSFPEDGYSVEMPTKLLSTFSTGENIKACADAGTGLFYMCASLIIPEDIDKSDEDEKIKNIINNYWKKQDIQIVEKRTVMTSGKPVKEFLMKKYGYYYRVRLLFNDKFTYLLLVGSLNQGIDHEDVNHFFKSVKFIPTKPVDWNLYTSYEGAFSVYFPGTPKENLITMPVTGKGEITSRMILANDPREGIQYLMQYFDGKGLIYASDSAFFASSLSSLQEDIPSDSCVSEKREQNGFPGTEATIYGKNKTTMKALTYLRGSRGYNLIALYPSNKHTNPNLTTFFNSFQMKDYGDSAWIKQSVCDSAIVISLPEKTTFKSEGGAYSAIYDSTHQYIAKDKFTGTTYHFEKSFFNKYYSAPGYDSIFNELANNNCGLGDSILSKTIYNYHGIPVMDLSIKSRESHNCARYRAFINDSSVYQAYVFTPVSLQNSETNNRFFESVTFNRKKEPSQLLVPKTNQLFKDLQSADSATHYGAGSKIGRHHFAKTDVPAIYNALLLEYISDTLEYGSARSKLFYALEDIADSTYEDFVTDNFDKFAKTPNLQLNSLDVLASQKTQTSRKLLFHLLLDKTPESDGTSMFWSLRDSMELNKPYFPDALKLISDSNYTESITMLTASMLQNGHINADALQAYYPQLYALAGKHLKDLKAYEKTEYYDESLITILSYIKMPESTEKLKSFAGSSNIQAKLYANIGLIKHGQKVKSSDLETVASFPGYRITLFTELDTIGKRSMFPARYYTQEFFAESDLWNVFSYDDGEPEKLELKSVIERTYKGEKKKFYCYKATFEYDDEKTSYFAVSGPFPVNSKDVMKSGDLTGSSYTEFDEKTIEEHLKEYLGE